MEWKLIQINKQNIKTDTGRAVLIACPHKSKYDGYCFWHPSKLVREGRHGGAVSIGYTEDFSFKLKKYGKGKYNGNEVIDEVEIGCSEFEAIFGVMDDNISAKQQKNEFETHKPQSLDAEKTEADDSLIDNE